MIRTYNLAEAKAKLSELLDRARAGDEVVIARHGKPMVRLLPVSASTPGFLGALAHWRIRLSEDAFELPATDPEEVAAAERLDLDLDTPTRGKRGRRPE